jgi:tRNA dimethylallyltransferase
MDTQATSRIHANDVPKMIRAIEVCLAAKQPMTQQWKAGREPLTGFDIMRIGLNPNRGELYRRIHERVLAMFDAGLVEETEQMLKKYGDAARPLSSIGYKQVVQLLKGEIDREAAVDAVQQAHRNYAKRQMTWFRREPNVTWIHRFGDDADVVQQSFGVVQASL